MNFFIHSSIFLWYSCVATVFALTCTLTTCRQSEWGHTKIFSDFDEETSDGDDMDAETSFGRRSKLSSKLNSKAPSLRLVTGILLPLFHLNNASYLRCKY